MTSFITSFSEEARDTYYENPLFRLKILGNILSTQYMYSFIQSSVPKVFFFPRKIEYEYQRSMMFFNLNVARIFGLLGVVIFLILDTCLYAVNHMSVFFVIAPPILAALILPVILLSFVKQFQTPMTVFLFQFYIFALLLVVSLVYLFLDGADPRRTDILLIIVFISFRSFPLILIFFIQFTVLFVGVIANFFNSIQSNASTFEDVFIHLVRRCTFYIIGFSVMFFSEWSARKTFYFKFITKRAEEELKKEKEQNHEFLLQVIPKQVVSELIDKHQNRKLLSDSERIIYKSHQCVTLIFLNIHNFADIALKLKASYVISLLNELVYELDHVMEQYDLYRIKNIGSVIMMASGVPVDKDNHLENAIFACFDFLKLVKQKKIGQTLLGYPIDIAIGANAGTVVAGVVGQKSYAFDLWGNTVNVAARMLYYAEPNSVHVPKETYDMLVSKTPGVVYDTKEADGHDTLVKGKGLMRCYTLFGRKDDSNFEKSANDYVYGRNDSITSNRSASPGSVRSMKSPVTTTYQGQQSNGNGLGIFSLPFASLAETDSLFKSKYLRSNADDIYETKIPDFLQKYLEETPSEEEKQVRLFMDEYAARLKSNKLRDAIVDSTAQKVPSKLVEKTISWKDKLIIWLLSPLSIHRLYYTNNYKQFVWSSRIILLISLLVFVLHYITEILYYAYGKPVSNYMEIIQLISYVRFFAFLPLMILLYIVSLTPLFKLHCVSYNLLVILFFLVFIGCNVAIPMLMPNNVIPEYYYISVSMLILIVHGTPMFIRLGLVLLLLVASVIWRALTDYTINLDIITLIITVVIYSIFVFIANRQEHLNFLMRGIQHKKSKLLKQQKEMSAAMLQNILPDTILEKLKYNLRNNAIKGNVSLSIEDVSMLFADIHNFTVLSGQISAVELVQMLNTIFCKFDEFAENHQIQKVKTIGDCYHCVSGIPEALDHKERMANFALDMLAFAKEFAKVEFRIGIHSGAVIAGLVIGKTKFQWDVYGPTVDICSGMEQTGEEMRIHCSQEFYESIQKLFVFTKREETVEFKGRIYQTYFLESVKQTATSSTSAAQRHKRTMSHFVE